MQWGRKGGSSKPTGTAGPALMVIIADRSDTGLREREREEWGEIGRQRTQMDRGSRDSNSKMHLG